MAYLDSETSRTHVPGTGVHDDTAYVQAVYDSRTPLPAGVYQIHTTIVPKKPSVAERLGLRLDFFRKLPSSSKK